MTVQGKWWNGVWGRLARRDIWLIVETETPCVVVERRGDSETGKVLAWEFPDESRARAKVQELLGAVGPGRWREMNPDQTTAPQWKAQLDR